MELVVSNAKSGHENAALAGQANIHVGDTTMQFRRGLRLTAVFSSLLAFAALGAGTASAQVVISQVYGGGGNSGAQYTHDFIEIFNRGSEAVNISGWSVQYASAAGTSWQVTNLSGTLQPGQYYLVQQAAGTGGTTPLPTPDATGSIAMSGTTGKVALVSATSPLAGSCPAGAAVQDMVGFGTANCYEGAAPAPGLSNTTAAIRADAGCTDTNDNSLDFTADTPAPRNTATPLHVCGGGGPEPTAPVVSFASGMVSVSEGDTTANTLTFTVNFSPAIATGETLAFDIDVSGSDPARFSYSGPTHVELDDTDTSPYLITVQTVPNTVTQPNVTVTVTLSDFVGADDGQTSPLSKDGTIVDDDVEIIPINQIQGAGQLSPYAGQTVTTRGIITAVTQSGPRFYIQSTLEDDDGNPATSEGLYVYGIPSPAPSPALAVGDYVIVTGRVSEYIPSTATQLPITELDSNVTVTRISSGHALPDPVVLTPADTATDSDLGYLERYEYMRVTVPSFVATAPSGAGANDEFFGTLEGFERPRREPGVDKFRCGLDPNLPGSRALPPEAPANVPCWDNNPELLRVKTNVIAGSSTLPVRTGTKFANLTGILDYGFERYTILTTSTPVPDTSNAQNGTPVTLPKPTEITVGAFNVEWLGCPTSQSSSCSAPGGAAYNRKVPKIARVIVDYLHMPDIIGFVEIYDTAVLSDVAAHVSAIAAEDPQYQAVQASTTTGAQRLGFLIKRSLVNGTPRVTLNGEAVEYGRGLGVVCPDGVTTTAPAGLLNDRPPQVINVTIRGENGQDFPLTVINNHLKAMGDHENTGPASGAYSCFNFDANGNPVSGGDGIRNRAKRQQNAEFLARLAHDLQQENPGQPIMLIGDFNAYEFNDGYADLTNTVAGTPPADDETVVTGDGVDLVDPDFIVLAQISETPVYSYTYEGNTQVIDQILVNEAALLRTVGLPRIEYALVNADFHQADATNTSNPFGSSDHDPSLAFLDIAAFRTADARIDAADPVATAGVGDTLVYEFTVANNGPDSAANLSVTLELPAGVTFTSLDEAAGWSCNAPEVGEEGSVVCFVDVLESDDPVASFTVEARVMPAADGTTATATLSLSTGSVDPEPQDAILLQTEIIVLPAAIFSDGFE